ncbi:TIGR04219 family outer membrane beta-barrel protein [Aliikangiella sp. IMCC44653]
MRKLLSVLAIASIASIPVAQADIAGFEVGAYQWSTDYDGTISSDSGNVLGDEINLRDDLGYTDDKNNIIWASLEHPLPFIPNFKLVSSDINASATNTLVREIQFAGETYSANADVATTVDLSNIEYTFYYEILDNWVNLDLGLTLRQYDGEVSLRTLDLPNNLDERENIDFTIPLVYAKARFDLPFTGFFIDAELNAISYDDDSVSDMLIALGYESDIGFGAKLGYRTFDLDVVDDQFTADVTFDGAYVSAFYHF